MYYATMQHLWRFGVRQWNWNYITAENPETAGFYIYTYTLI